MKTLEFISNFDIATFPDGPIFMLLCMILVSGSVFIYFKSILPKCKKKESKKTKSNEKTLIDTVNVLEIEKDVRHKLICLN